MYWKHYAGRNRSHERRGRRYGYRRPKYNTPVNIIDKETEFELHLHAPTFEKDNIKIAVAGDTMYITGTREPKDDSPNFLLQEYPIKSFERSFELSERADRENIKATFKDGILTVIVQKTTAASEPEVEIEVE